MLKSIAKFVRNPDRPTRLLAVASRGGHWVQMQRMRPAWRDCETTYVTTEPGYGAPLQREAQRNGEAAPGFYTVVDANRWQKLRLLKQLGQIAWIVLRTRPDVILSTGAAPGYFAIRLGRLLGARTIWIDSIANAEELSLAGRKAGPHADVFLTQWPHLSGWTKAGFRGQVI